MSRLTARRGDEGFTLIELLVVLMLTSIVGTVVMTTTIGSLRTASRQEDQSRTLNASKVALERITREIRGANSLTTTADREVAFVTRTEGVRRATRIVARVTTAGTELVQIDTRSNLTTGASLGTTEKVILGGLAVGRSEAVFKYYAGDYYGEGNAATQELNPATPGSVRTVGVRVRLLRGYGAPPLDLYQVVSVRNLES